MKRFISNLHLIFILILLGMTVLIWQGVFYLEARQNIRVTFFDVGQGDAILIEAPNGNQILIDGGPGDRVLAKLGRALPFWDRSLDLLVLTHPHADHLDGLLEVLKRYEIEMVFESGVNHTIPEYEEWRLLLKERKVNTVIAKAGQRIHFYDSAHLDILAPLEDYEGKSPKNIHEAMIVSKFIYASTTVLLTGDAEKLVEYQLLFSGAPLDADILKAGHHGSKTSTTEEFLSAVSPRAAIISSGRKNRYGHPHQEVLGRLAAIGAKIFRTDLDGDIQITSDGRSHTLTTIHKR